MDVIVMVALVVKKRVERKEFEDICCHECGYLYLIVEH